MVSVDHNPRITQIFISGMNPRFTNSSQRLQIRTSFASYVLDWVLPAPTAWAHTWEGPRFISGAEKSPNPQGDSGCGSAAMLDNLPSPQGGAGVCGLFRGCEPLLSWGFLCTAFLELVVVRNRYLESCRCREIAKWPSPLQPRTKLHVDVGIIQPRSNQPRITIFISSGNQFTTHPFLTLITT